MAEGRQGPFDVLFFTRSLTGEFRASHVYLNAERVPLAEAYPDKNKMGAQRRSVLKALKASPAHVQEYFNTSSGANVWKVRLTDIRVFDDAPVIAPLRETDLRFTNAYDYSEWEGWDDLLGRARPLHATRVTPAERPRVKRFSVTRYRAFQQAELELAPLTFIIGRNNAGKSALCRAPWLATRAWLRDARLPAPLRTAELDLGESIRDLIYRGDLQGMELGAWLTEGSSPSYVKLGIAYDGKRNARQIISRLEVAHAGEPPESQVLPAWQTVKDRLAELPALDELARGVKLVTGLRALPERGARWDGFAAEDVSATGRGAYELWASALEDSSDDPQRSEGLRLLREWAERVLLITPTLKVVAGRIDVSIKRVNSTFGAHLQDSGAGVGQALPLLIMLTLTQPKDQPWLFCMEQPELHLHPRAHPELTELLSSVATAPDGPWFLIETHSDAMILRARVLVAEGKLRPDQVRVYFVEESEQGGELREIKLNDRGTPDWWPKGVFAETQEEFLRLRRALAQRDAR
ncbi:MAG: AAA family ATPase [Deltaproteobacteria bacterium]|nr:AAA family ATPase [Deltaproteobacteria bacterium]